MIRLIRTDRTSLTRGLCVGLMFASCLAGSWVRNGDGENQVGRSVGSGLVAVASLRESPPKIKVGDPTTLQSDIGNICLVDGDLRSANGQAIRLASDSQSGSPFPSLITQHVRLQN